MQNEKSLVANPFPWLRSQLGEEKFFFFACALFSETEAEVTNSFPPEYATLMETNIFNTAVLASTLEKNQYLPGDSQGPRAFL